MATAEERFATLEAMIDDLRARLDRATQRDSMHKTLTCPACGGGHILAVRQINDATARGVMPLSLGQVAGFWTPDQTVEPLFAYVCKACKLVEVHAYAIEKLVPDGQSVVELVRPADAAPAEAPYR